MAAVAGIDGCNGGWVVVTVSLDGQATSVERVTDLTIITRRLDSGHLVAVGIDVPIGLPGTGSRRCDLEARKMIGSRASSVFPAPFRAVLGAETYEDALAKCQSISGKGMSRQGFAILPKIREVDRLMTPARQQNVFEVHPEVCFTLLAGAPMSHHKAKPEGRTQRLAVLRRAFADIDARAVLRLPGTRPDDILDAYVAAWTAQRWTTHTHSRLGESLMRAASAWR